MHPTWASPTDPWHRNLRIDSARGRLCSLLSEATLRKCIAHFFVFLEKKQFPCKFRNKGARALHWSLVFRATKTLQKAHPANRCLFLWNFNMCFVRWHGHVLPTSDEPWLLTDDAISATVNRTIWTRFVHVLWPKQSMRQEQVCDAIPRANFVFLHREQQIRRCPCKFRVRFQAVKVPSFGGFSLGNPTNKAIASNLVYSEVFWVRLPRFVWARFQHGMHSASLKIRRLLAIVSRQGARDNPCYNQAFWGPTLILRGFQRGGFARGRKV